MRPGNEAREVVLREADADLAVEKRPSSPHRTRRPHGTLARQPDLDAFGSGEPVRDERCLQRDDERDSSALAHLVRDVDEVGHAGRSISRNGYEPPFVCCGTIVSAARSGAHRP